MTTMTLALAARKLGLAAGLIAAISMGSAHASLVGYWDLDSSNVDSGPNGFSAADSGTVGFGGPGANANTGTSANYSGGGSIDVSYDGLLNPQSFTLTAWAMPSTAGGGSGGYRSVVTSRDDQNPNSDGYVLYKAANGDWEFWSGNGAGAGNWDILNGPAAAMDTWTHLALSYDAATGTKSLYVNGGPPVTAAQVYEPNAHEGLHIGGGGDTGTSFRWNGDIDDVTIWNEALTQVEIQSIMDNSVQGIPDPMVLANFDMGPTSDPPFASEGPAGLGSTSWTKVTTGSPTLGDNGISAHVFNGTTFLDPGSAGSELTDDFHVQVAGDGTANWAISGLDDDAIYDIYLVAPDGTGFGATNIYGADYVLTTGFADASTLRATGGTTEAFADFVAGRDYVIFTNARSDGGVFAGLTNRIAGQPHTGLAGIQVVLLPVSVPEPSTLFLTGLALCSVALGTRRRRR